MGEKYMSEEEVRHFKILMFKRGYKSIVKLAGAMGMTRNALSRKINGKSDWSRTEMEMVGKLFDKDPANIFFGK
jgi:hypothetical protein